MNKQPPPRVYLSGCFRLTEEYASPGQKFRVLSVEATEHHDAESLHCNSTEKEQMQVWLRYIKYRAEKYRDWARSSRIRARKSEFPLMAELYLENEMKYQESAYSLEALLSTLSRSTAEELRDIMGEKDGKED